MGYMLDRCEFPSALWDRGAKIFRRSNKIRGAPELSLAEWDRKAFENPIIQLIWQMFPGMLLWHTWKERNNRIFKDKSSSVQSIIDKILNQLKETIISLRKQPLEKPMGQWDVQIIELLGLILN